MKGDRYATLATRLLRDVRRGASVDLGDRAAGIAAIEQALGGRRRRARLLRGSGVALVAGVLVTIGLTLPRSRPGPDAPAHAPVASAPARPIAATVARGRHATLVRQGTRIAAAAGTAVMPGDQIRAPGHGAQIDLPGGTRLVVAPDGALDLLDLGPHARLALRAGRVQADVAKLAPGERFVLVTADAEVEVKGTSFEVAVVANPGCPGGTATWVKVQEGVVAVTSGDAVLSLRAGESWSRPCPPVPSRRAILRGSATERVRPARAHRPRAPEMPDAPATVAEPTVAPLPSSTLREENDLFAAALLAEKTGDVAAALRHFDELLVRFPGGSLAAAAREQRHRLAGASQARWLREAR